MSEQCRVQQFIYILNKRQITMNNKHNLKGRILTEVNQDSKNHLEKTIRNPENSKKVLYIHQKNNYKILKLIGNGTFGKVYLVQNEKDKHFFALKQVFQDKKYKNRELQIIKQIKHPNLISLQDFYYTENGDQYLHLVMQYIPETLSKIIRKVKKQGYKISSEQLKLYTFQLLRSLAYMQGIGICHRDIKPQNILLNMTTNQVKICDFGSAKRLIQGEKNISYICSRYYRAPQLIFGKSHYKFSIDVWSMGCVLCQMVIGQPIFPGQSPMKQLIEIMKVIGTPTYQQLISLNSLKKVQLPQIKSITLKKILTMHNADKEFIDLVQKMLKYNPDQRIKPLEGLLHQFLHFNRTQRKKYPYIFTKLTEGNKINQKSFKQNHNSNVDQCNYTNNE